MPIMKDTAAICNDCEGELKGARKWVDYELVNVINREKTTITLEVTSLSNIIMQNMRR